LPYGVLEIGSTSKHSFDSYDIDFLTGIANIIAGAYDASRRAAALQVALNRMQELVDDKNLFLARNNALLEEKNRLLDENAGWMRDIRHLVRNDFQMVYEALSDQLRATTDPTAVRAIGASARRVMTLVEVYDHLLGAELGRTIELGKYLSSLCSSFEVLEKSRQPNIELIYHFEPVVCDVDNVASLGIVIAELMANSCAHAFPDGTGSIRVSLALDQESNIVTIVFSDDGVGFVEASDGKRHGLASVRRLIEQIGGSATLRSDHGATWTLKFPVPISPSVCASVPKP
jgi:two-component sensor histidine kinase